MRKRNLFVTMQLYAYLVISWLIYVFGTDTISDIIINLYIHFIYYNIVSRSATIIRSLCVWLSGFVLKFALFVYCYAGMS